MQVLSGRGVLEVGHGVEDTVVAPPSLRDARRNHRVLWIPRPRRRGSTLPVQIGGRCPAPVTGGGVTIAQRDQGAPPTSGWGATKNEICRPDHGRLIDPAKVVRSSVESATSGTAMILTNEALITDLTEKDMLRRCRVAAGMDYYANRSNCLTKRPAVRRTRLATRWPRKEWCQEWGRVAVPARRYREVRTRNSA
jgi:hypothetical protein